MSESEMFELFAKNATRKRESDGHVTIACNKGLWSVSAPTSREAFNEAFHYFTQYLSDGEYDD